MNQNDSVWSISGFLFLSGNLFVFSSPNLLLDFTAKDSTSVLLNYFSTSEEITFSLSSRSVVMVGARFYYIKLKQCRKNDDTVHFSEYRKTLKSEVGLSLSVTL